MKPQSSAGLFAVTLGAVTVLCASAFAEGAAGPLLAAAPEAPKTETKAAAANQPAPLPAITATPGSPEEVAQLRALVEALTSRLQGVEAAQKKTDETVSKNAPTVSSGSKLPVVVSGLLQFRGDQFNNQEGPAPSSFDTFRMRRAELRITAPAITSRISGTVMFDLAKRISQNGALAVNQNSTFFQEMTLSYLLRKGKMPSTAGAAPSNIYIDAGQFKLPIGYEGDLIGSSALPFVERALMFAARDPFGGGFGDIRDTGVQLRGTQGQFRYWAGIFNGLGERQNNDSASDTKAIIARLAFDPRSIPGLTVGVSGARGNNRNTPTAGTGANRDLFTVFANWQRKKWTLRGEYLTGDSQTFPLNPATVNNDVRGYYGHVGYMFTKKIEGVARYDFFDFDRNLSDATVRDLSAGINYYIKGNNAKIQANVVRRSGGTSISSGNGFSSSLVNQYANDRTEFRLQAQAAF